MNRRWIFIFYPLFLPWLAFAQPAEVSRVLKTFDFEERRLGNPEDIPMNWRKVEGAGLPHYVNGKMTTERARSGKFAFQFDLNGGSLIYRYEAGRLRVRPGAHYHVEAFCQTTKLAHARARMTAYFADIDGRPIEASRTQSDLYAAKDEGEPWKELTADLSAGQGAASLIIELGLLQPAAYQATSLGEKALFPQDIRGSAWFDDVRVSQAPQVELSTERAGNIFRRSEAVRLIATINDVFINDLSAQIIVHDAAGKAVHQRSGAIDLASAKRTDAAETRVTIDLPDLPPGWYAATLLIQSGKQSIGSERLDLIRLPDNAPLGPPDGRFGVIATDLPSADWRELPEILPLLATGRVKLAMWSKREDVQKLDVGLFDALLEKLSSLNVTPTACLVDLPPTVANRVGGSAWTQLLKAKDEDWQADLSHLISRHGNHLDRWQLGADGTDDFVTQPAMRQVYAKVYREFQKLMYQPDLAMPWPAWYELEGQLPATVALSAPPSVLPNQLPLYTQDFRNKPGHNLSLTLQLIDAEKYGREAQIRDLAQRVIYALASGESRIDLPLPFRMERRGSSVVKQPLELLMIVRTLLTTLSGSTYRGQVPIAEGIEAFLFDRNGRGVIVLWDRGGQSGDPLRDLAINLGPRATCVDLWGNVAPLTRVMDDKQAGRVRVRVGSMPLLLMDVDGYMAQLRASVAFDKPLLESSFRPHSRRLKFVNAYPHPIAGQLKLKAPKGWSVSPPTFTFSLNPGEVFDREVTIEFPYNSYAGTKAINAEFTFSSGDGNDFTMPVGLKLGLSDVGMQTLALRDGSDVIVQQMVTNYGEKPINYDAFAVCPGLARQERLVQNLGPGRTVVKKYRFTNARAGELKIRVGLKESNGTRVLNEEATVQ